MECNDCRIYERNGCSKEAIKLFEQTKYVGINPNDITFVSILSPYSHVVIVKKEYQYFKFMNDYYYHIKPKMKYFSNKLTKHVYDKISKGRVRVYHV